VLEVHIFVSTTKAMSNSLHRARVSKLDEKQQQQQMKGSDKLVRRLEGVVKLRESSIPLLTCEGLETP
jgi:hypothetical protein